jgi:hypothetical protein
LSGCSPWSYTTRGKDATSEERSTVACGSILHRTGLDRSLVPRLAWPAGSRLLTLNWGGSVAAAVGCGVENGDRIEFCWGGLMDELDSNSLGIGAAAGRCSTRAGRKSYIPSGRFILSNLYNPLEAQAQQQHNNNISSYSHPLSCLRSAASAAPSCLPLHPLACQPCPPAAPRVARRHPCAARLEGEDGRKCWSNISKKYCNIKMLTKDSSQNQHFLKML